MKAPGRTKKELMDELDALWERVAKPEIHERDSASRYLMGLSPALSCSTESMTSSNDAWRTKNESTKQNKERTDG